MRMFLDNVVGLLDVFLLEAGSEAGLFESKTRLRYACVHLGRFTKEMSPSIIF
jgi:hypothetical protein